MGRSSENPSTLGQRWKAFRKRMFPPAPPGISEDEALAIGRKYYHEQGWKGSQGFRVETSAHRDGDTVVDTFEVSLMTGNGGNGFVHIRRSDGKVLAYTSTPR